jgi:hypothetical protein
MFSILKKDLMARGHSGNFPRMLTFGQNGAYASTALVFLREHLSKTGYDPMTVFAICVAH